ncbi:hypothetical protein P3T18_003181 [Paraburkholderia sp. GAS199]|uniref:DUF4148 domain-containing protein n=1 Tax=Paraburkholderia sp. GAS199 TaxID=3035126 RepID=UPI003D22BDE5
MQYLVKVAVVGAILAAPVISFAQSNQPLTRAQVRQELVELHNAGYNSLDDRNSWPTHYQQAQARITAQKDAQAGQAAGYGSTTSGSTESGQH